MNLMLPDSGLIFWMTIIFAIVFFILARFGFPVITGMVEKRNKRIADSLEAARVAEEAVAHLDREKERILSETRSEQERILLESAAERDRIIEEAQLRAMAEAQKIMEDARSAIRDEKEAALKEVRHEVAVISLAVAEKILGSELSKDEVRNEYVEKLLDEISSLT